MYNFQVLSFDGERYNCSYSDHVYCHDSVSKKSVNYTICPFNGKKVRVRFVDSLDEISSCAEASLQASMSRTRSSLRRLLASSLDWKWFVTFTFDKDKVDRYNYDDCILALGSFLDSVRVSGMQYVIVPERHKDGAFHFHGVFNGALDVSLCGRFANQGIYNLDSWTFGFSTVTAVRKVSAVCNYIAKYITKDLCSAVNRKRYLHSRSTLHPTSSVKFLLLRQHFIDFLNSVKVEDINLYVQQGKFCKTYYFSLSLDDILLLPFYGFEYDGGYLKRGL